MCIRDRPEGFSFDLSSGEIDEGEAIEDQAEDEEEDKGDETERLKRLKKLKFDRRPSAALAAWAKAAEREEQPAAPKTNDAAPDPIEIDTSGMSEEEAADAIADAEKKRERARKKAEKEAEKRAEEEAEKALDRELLHFQRMVTLGEWPELQAYLASLPKREGLAAYAQLVTSLEEGPERASGSMRSSPRRTTSTMKRSKA